LPFALDGSSQSDEGGQPEGDEKLDDVPDALHAAAQQRAGRPDLHYVKPPRTGQLCASAKHAITAST
jgi:hypothetical protein